MRLARDLVHYAAGAAVGIVATALWGWHAAMFGVPVGIAATVLLTIAGREK